jgi:hypothetical protein
MTVDAGRMAIHEPAPAEVRTPEAIQAAAEAAANALLGRANGEICGRCEAVLQAYAAADEALLCYETLAASRLVADAYEGVRALRRDRRWQLRGRLWRTADEAREAADAAIVDRRVRVTRTMSVYVTSWFQLHAALTELRAQAMYLIEAARVRIVEVAAGPLPVLTPLRDEQLGTAERIAGRFGPDELRTRLKQADCSIKRQIGGDLGADTQALD